MKKWTYSLVGLSLLVIAAPAARAQEEGTMVLHVKSTHATSLARNDEDDFPATPVTFVSIEKPRDTRIDARVAELRSDAALMHARGDANGVLTAYRAALFLDNRDPELYADLGDALLDKGVCAEAMRRYRESVGMEPGQGWSASRMDEGDLHLRFALALLRCSCFEDALSLYQMGVDRLPAGERKLVATRFNGNGLRKDVQERQRFEAAIHIALGLRYTAFGRVDKAVDQVKTALSLSPSEPLAQLMLGNLMRAKGQKGEAQVAWQKAAEGSNSTIRGWATQALAQNR
jgi:tetratricopeptide (TPR) repeat protein